MPVRSLRQRPVLFGALLALFLLGGVAILGWTAVIGLGLYDTSATSLHSRIAYFLIHTTMINSVGRRAYQVGNLPKLQPGDVASGATLYAQHCEVCHGGVGVARAFWANGLNPNPPYLVDAQRHWSAKELRFIIGHGVKMTAMPAWRLTLDNRQMWALVAFLEAMPKLDSGRYLDLTSSSRASAPPQARKADGTP